MAEQVATPRTDAIIAAADDGSASWADTAVAIARGCGQIERELVAMTAEREALKDDIQRHVNIAADLSQDLGAEQSISAHAQTTINELDVNLVAAESREQVLREAVLRFLDSHAWEKIAGRDYYCIGESCGTERDAPHMPACEAMALRALCAEAQK